jgi:uncharacterized protein YjbI with pentapeptide repeats
LSLPTDVAMQCVDKINSATKVRRLLGHAEIRCQLIGEELARRLLRQHRSALSSKIAGSAIEVCAKRIRDSSRTIKFIKSSMTDPKSSSLAASLLVSCEPGWKPPNLKNICFDGAHLPAVRWSAVRLVRCSFHRADLRGADFRKATLSKSTFVGANLADADLSGAEFSQSSAWQATLVNATIVGATAPESKWNYALLRNAHFDESKLAGAWFSPADLSQASFVRCDLRQASFCRASLENADFSFADCSAANFSHCDLRSTLLSESRCAKAKFVEANLEDVNLHSIELIYANLSAALLSGSQMRGANLRNAELVGARMAEIDWEGCDLRGADLRNCDFHYGSTRCGLVDSPYPSHGTRTGFYTDDYDDRYYRRPEEIRKANLCGCDLRGARIDGTDFYLVDLRGATFDRAQRKHLVATGAILE